MNESERPAPAVPSEPVGLQPEMPLESVPVLGAALAPSTAAPPVEAQRSSQVNAAKLASEKVVVAAPMSYAGSAARIWKLTGLTPNAYARVGLAGAAIALILIAWCFVTSWYIVFGLLLVPYRLIRRGSRKRKREALQHREMLAAITERRE